MISIIACISKDLGLGKDGRLLWNIPEDMKFFRETTSGSTVVMGRKTYESIGRPLPNRRNIVLGQKPESSPENLEWCSSEAELRKLLATIDGEIFIIGGASLYQMFINEADRLLLTEVDAAKPADTFFPEFNRELFRAKTLQTGKTGDVAWQIRDYQRLNPSTS